MGFCLGEVLLNLADESFGFFYGEVDSDLDSPNGGDADVDFREVGVDGYGELVFI
jgi:hypothetical protein